MDYNNLTAPCGIDCFNCPGYLAKTNLELRKNLSQRMNIPKEQAFCEGCRREKGIIKFIGNTIQCGTYACTEGKNIHTCAECGAEFPCDRLHPYADKAAIVPHNTKIFNICLIRKMGLEEWAKEKAGQVKKDYYQKKLVVCAP